MNTTCQFTDAAGHVCGAALVVTSRSSRRMYCQTCIPLANARRRKERAEGRFLRSYSHTVRVRVEPSPKVRPASKDMAERYARIIAQYGAPGMGIAPNTRVRVMKAWRL